MVKAAYSSGKPALGVGAGNAPAYVDTDVDIVRAANDLVLSKHFDYGMICATEQAIIAHKDVYDQLIKELKVRKAYFVNAEEKAKLEQYMFGCTAGSGVKPVLNSAVPGKSPQFIAKAAGFEIPSDATILAAECKEVSDDEPLTHEARSGAGRAQGRQQGAGLRDVREDAQAGCRPHRRHPHQQPGARA